MFIKSIVLDGFKSYGNRVEISGFDSEFNAITGLNGTGKSNILDSICFVLGITNLSNVRAGSLQELIYKHGQAGITKATVSVTFDNRDKSHCPIGYENHNDITVTRQVVMGGKNKYLINGINVQNKRVSDLFCSVQLNVNNPHFLIMQGRITKVLNMKPPEILAMVEEAAGTRMYEAKKQAAQKTIEKKDAKLRELNDIIKEDIAPKLQKLQDERSQFQEYQKVVREMENLTRLHVAWKYLGAEKAASEARKRVLDVRNELTEGENSLKHNEEEARKLDTKANQLNKKLDEESGEVLKGLEVELLSREKCEAATGAAHRSAADTLATHEKRARLLKKQLTEDDLALVAKRKALQEATSQFAGLRVASESSATSLAEAQKRFLAISSGLEGDSSDSSSASKSLQDQLIMAKQEASEASTRISQATMEKKHCEERLTKLKREFKSTSLQYEKDQKHIQHMENELAKLQSELSKLDFSEERNVELKNSCRSLEANMRCKRDKVDNLSAYLQKCNFNYRDPETNWDRRRVKGTVCRLIQVSDPIYCTALETAAGARLYNVVVDTEVTSKLLLQRGNLQTRTTIIPLNKISGNVIDRNTLRLAQQVGGGANNVQLALDLISFDNAVRPAMEWVFGGTLVCRDLDTARSVTFDPRIKRRCVTIDGDVFDPAGTISGGARQKGGSLLVQLDELKKCEDELQRVEVELNKCSCELQAQQQRADTYSGHKQRYELMSHELGVVKARLETTSHHQMHKEIEALENELQRLSDTLNDEQKRQREATDTAAKLESKVKDIKGHREREFKKAESELKKATSEAEKNNALWKQREQELETLQIEVAELEQTVEGSRQQLEQEKIAAENLKEQLDKAKELLEAAKDSVKCTQLEIKRQKTEMAAKSVDIAQLIKKKEALIKANNDLALKAKELEYKVKELQTEAAEHEKKISSLESDHPWVLEEREYFGCPGGPYDLEAREVNIASTRLQQLKDRKEKLARGLNSRAHTLLGKEEEQYQDVMRKKRTVEQDRAKLIQVMSELDEKKRRTLVAACEQVNREFGSIFGTLLPGAHAKLTPPDGQTVLQGLEVKVGFNNTWKESLSELSGGQRSLVALSLVLAMLQFKPAPLYILDEVDAALDLSHTQNIGAMLKEHFTHSQFIIVSLKEGMFNNANVLFRTKFVDGMSSVERTSNIRR